MTADEWREQAACRQVPISAAWDPFYDPGSGGRTSWTEARQLCDRCPVAHTCLDDAFVEDKRHEKGPYGFRGGFSPRQRRGDQDRMHLELTVRQQAVGLRAPPPPPTVVRRRELLAELGRARPEKRRLTDDDVREVFAMRAAGVRVVVIAQKFEISAGYVYQLLRGTTKRVNTIMEES